MNGDPHQGRFMAYLSLFTGFMLVLVTADNLVVMFFGWEGIGLASFLLISFWHTRIQASKSAIKAMLVNRVGDVGLALGICIIFLTFKSVEYSTVFALVPCVIDKTLCFFGFEFRALTIISFLLFWGVLGKSAQLSLHVWLPDAMEGPTPVSALIHAATLVVAGVFLIIRCSILFESSESVLMVVSVIGALTSFFAASVGLFQNDLKRVIAYSTCSQLGYMVFIAGLSHYSVSLFHVANHAVFKALLFLSAGCVIHGMSDEQDLRKMGGLLNLFPVSYTMILIGSLALVGTPFLTGFYSKDCILELAVAKHTTVGNFCYFLGCSAAFCTSFYSFRLVFLTFVNPTNTYKKYIEHAHEAPITMVFPLIILGLGAIFYGFLSRDLVIGLGSLFFNNVHTNYYNFNLVDSEFLAAWIKNIPFVFTVLGALFSLLLINCFNVNKSYVMDLKLQPIPKALYVFLNKKWHFDQIINELVVVKIMNFGYLSTFQSLDKGLIERLGPTGFTVSIFQSSSNFVSYSTGVLYNTTFVFITFAILFLSFFYFRLAWFTFNC
jgi:proton-translocating NADH-quinone oxidoreductase chain L